MTIKSTRILLAAAFLSTTATAAILAAPASATTLNEAVQRHLQAAQNAAGKNDFATAAQEITAARGISGRTPYDDLMINRFAIPVEVGAKDIPAASQAAEDVAQLALFLASPASDGLTGRLISSIHDDWAGMAGRGSEISKTEWYTLRRVKPE